VITVTIGEWLSEPVEKSSGALDEPNHPEIVVLI